MPLLIIDGNSILNRAYYGIKLLSTKDGQYTNGLVGFLNILGQLRDKLNPTHIAVAFDLPFPTFRHQRYAAYKAGRKGMPDELRQQMPLLKEILPLMGIAVVEKEGYEADDLLGTLSAAAAAQGLPCAIATGDRDALQLVGEYVTVLLAGTKETIVYDPAAIFEKYGLSPAQLIDLKALMGDSGDNIPGVPGVGEKTALDLLHRFHSMDALYDGLETADIRDTLRAKLLIGKESAYLSRELGTICQSVPVDQTMDSYLLQPVCAEPLAALFARLELFKFIDKMGLNRPSPVKESVAAAPVPCMEEAAAWPDCRAYILANRRLDCLADMTQGTLVALWVAFGGRIARFPAEMSGFSELLSFLEDETILKRTHYAKPLFAALLAAGRHPAGIEMDTLLAAYLLNPLASGYALERLAQEYAVFFGTADDIHLLPLVADKLTAEIETAQMTSLLRTVEIPLALVLADMENTGFVADGQGIADFGSLLQSRIEDIEQQIYAAVGYSFNLNSPKQLAKALFEDLKLPAKKKTKSGYSTNADVLEQLRFEHPCIEMLLEYRTLAKLKSTYCDGLLKVIGNDGRIHTSFNQTETRTGRISSTEPNLQNIPVRQTLGRELRRFFRAEKGWTLCDADYSQIELRVLAHMSQDPTMLYAFNDGLDIHRITASQVFDVPEELVTPLMRSRAKAVNFGIVYGIGAHSLSEDIGVSYGEAKTYIEEYLHHYSAVAGFMERMIAAAKETGYAKTMFDRRRPLPELHAANAITRGFGERVARNMPIQGTAADIIKMAMVRVYARLRREHLRARLILQVHDELIVEAPLEEAEKAASILKEEMEAAVTLSVKLLADVHTGETWYDAKG